MAYKEEHEEFVSGNNGTTAAHIVATVIAAGLPVNVRDLMLINFPFLASLTTGWSYLFEYLILIVPMQLVMTLFSEQANAMLLIVILNLALLYNSSIPKVRNIESKVTAKQIKMGSRRPFITYYRASVNILTSFLILAVDFKILPRYFGKTETYGTGLMDIGVGGFLFSNAVVSQEARGIASSEKPLMTILKSVKSSLPLWILGVCRVVAVKSTGYQEHVTEYGVHWNFFFTLAAVKVTCTIIFCLVPNKLWNTASVLIIAIYQHNMMHDGLKDYLINGADGKGGRTDLFDANREGIFSCAGYLSLYILAVQIGKLVMKKRETMLEWTKLCVHLGMVTIASWIMLFFCEKFVDPVSRRFANLSYVIWMLAFNSLLLMILLLMDIVTTYVTFLRHFAKHLESKKTNTQESKDEKDTDVFDVEVQYQTSPLANSVNYNGLFYFLLANLLTGAVNMCMRTMHQPTGVAMGTLTAYMLVLSSVSMFLYQKKIQLKFW